MDLQTSTAAPTGGYAFVVNGTDVVKTLPVAFGGVFNIDSPNTISGNGSVTDEIVGNKVNATALGLSGTLTSPDQFGAVTLNLTAPFGAANKPMSLQFTGYIVDATHIELIETDAVSGSGFGLTGGVAIGQGNATGIRPALSSRRHAAGDITPGSDELPGPLSRRERVRARAVRYATRTRRVLSPKASEVENAVPSPAGRGLG